MVVVDDFGCDVEFVGVVDDRFCFGCDGVVVCVGVFVYLVCWFGIGYCGVGFVVLVVDWLYVVGVVGWVVGCLMCGVFMKCWLLLLLIWVVVVLLMSWVDC